MKHDYQDITSRIAEPPAWWDEHGVPRYGAFEPGLQADLYAEEVALLAIECQNCGHAFEVCVSGCAASDRNVLLFKSGHAIESLADLITTQHIRYGDPPNVGCCPSGPTMASVPRRVLQYWKRRDFKTVKDAVDEEWWKRDASLEITVRAEWDREDHSLDVDE